MSYRIYQFGTLVIPHLNPVTDVGVAAADMSLIQLPGGRVHNPHGGKRAPRGPVRLTKRTAYLYDTEAALLAGWEALTGMARLRDRLWRARAGTTPQWAWATLEKVEAQRRSGQSLWLDASLTWLIESPVWYAQTTVDVTYSGESGPDPFVLALPNAGNHEVEEIRFTWTFAGSGFRSVWAENLTNGYRFDWSGNVGAGAVLEIHTAGSSVRLNGVGAYNGFGWQLDRWMVLDKGANNVSVPLETVSGGESLRVEYYLAGTA
jgi:hypothetical protein